MTCAAALLIESMKLSRKIAVALFGMLGLTSERARDLVAPPSEPCEVRCQNDDCFTTIRLQPIEVEGQFAISVQATQSIVEQEVMGTGPAPWLLRHVGKNEVPGYAFPDANRLIESGEFKVTNGIVIAGRVENGRLSITNEVPASQVASTHLLGMGLEGKTYAHGPFHTSPNRVEYCLLGGIARPAALPNGFRRIVIGSRIMLDAQFATPTRAIVTPTIRCSRFPTTFLWASAGGEKQFRHNRAHALKSVLAKCATWE